VPQENPVKGGDNELRTNRVFPQRLDRAFTPVGKEIGGRDTIFTVTFLEPGATLKQNGERVAMATLTTGQGCAHEWSKKEGNIASRKKNGFEEQQKEAELKESITGKIAHAA